jgi:hypothetical protein
MSKRFVCEEMSDHTFVIYPIDVEIRTDTLIELVIVIILNFMDAQETARSTPSMFEFIRI